MHKRFVDLVINEYEIACYKNHFRNKDLQMLSFEQFMSFKFPFRYHAKVKYILRNKKFIETRAALIIFFTELFKKYVENNMKQEVKKYLFEFKILDVVFELIQRTETWMKVLQKTSETIHQRIKAFFILLTEH